MKKILQTMILFCAAIGIFIGTHLTVSAAEEIKEVTITDIPIFAKDASIAEANITTETSEGCILETQWLCWDDELKEYVRVTEGIFDDDAVYILSLKASAKKGYIFSEDFAFVCDEGIEMYGWWSEEEEDGEMIYTADLGTRTFTTEIREILITTPKVEAGNIASAEDVQIELRSNDEVIPNENIACNVMWIDENDYMDITGAAFEKEKIYQLNIDLAVGTGYSLANDVLVTINGEEDFGFYEPKSLNIFRSYSLLTPIESVEFSGLSEVKEGNSIADTIKLVSDIEEIGEFFAEWYDEEDNEVTEDTFVAGKTYHLFLDVNIFNGAPLSEDFVFIFDGEEYAPTDLYSDYGQAFIDFECVAEEVRTPMTMVVVVAATALVVIMTVMILFLVVRKRNKRK